MKIGEIFKEIDTATDKIYQYFLNIDLGWGFIAVFMFLFIILQFVRYN